MTTTTAPRGRADLMLQEVGREGLLYDRERELIHLLNATALAVWKSCDGQRDLAAIESIIRSRFTGLDGRDVRGDIETLLMQLDERGLLEGGNTPRTAAQHERPLTGPQRRT